MFLAIDSDQSVANFKTPLHPRNISSSRGSSSTESDCTFCTAGLIYIVGKSPKVNPLPNNPNFVRHQEGSVQKT